jgi:2-polyprenyl-3-methyl-5-hydroxy-6-metoxy-1,4-benzoquinol methylase
MVTAVIVAVALALLAGVLWRLSSSRASLPCPAWLACLVEMDNPFFKNHQAGVIISHLDPRPGMRVLDFGCGPGRLSIPLALAVGRSGWVTAMDIQEKMLERVKEKASMAGLGNIETVLGGADAPGLTPGGYDRALMVAVLGEVPDKRSLLKSLSACLKPGGVLGVSEVIADPHFQPRGKVRALAGEAGFVETGCRGNAVSFTMTLQKPRAG